MEYSERNCVLCNKMCNGGEFCNEYLQYYCDRCGSYIISTNPEKFNNVDRSKMVTYLYYHKSDNKTFFIGSKEDFGNYSDNPQYVHLTKEEIENWYPRKFSDKIDLILLKLAEMLGYGEEKHLSETELHLLMFVCRFDGNAYSSQTKKAEQFLFVLDYLKNQEYIANVAGSNLKLMPSGWLRIDELQKDIQNNKNVFVSMAFNEGTKSTRAAIKEGILRAGYSPELIDEIIHNHQIVPEMFRLIRECRFLILDISDPNYGAYYEAGYAYGLGKEVIICCKNSVFSKDFLPEEKHLKPHFDIAQKQMLVWDDERDLTNKLSEWIKAIIG